MRGFRPEGNVRLLNINPGALVLDVGRLGPNGLCESRLRDANKSAWKVAVKELKRRTPAGGIVTSEKTDASASSRDHRLSQGAIALMNTGVALRPMRAASMLFRPLKQAPPGGGD